MGILKKTYISPISHKFRVKDSKKSADYRTDTLFKKTSLSPNKVKTAYELFLNLKLLDIPTGKKIKRWSKGADGITYIIK